MYGLLLCFLLCIIITFAHIITKFALESQKKEIFLLVELNSDESAEIKIRSAIDTARQMNKKIRGIIAVDTGLSQEGRDICRAFSTEIGGLYLVTLSELPEFLQKSA